MDNVSLHIKEIIDDVFIFNIAVVLTGESKPSDSDLMAAEALFTFVEVDEKSAEYNTAFAVIYALAGQGYLNVDVTGTHE